MLITHGNRTRPGDVGCLLLSNGMALTAIDRMANEEADRLAKFAANAVRVPPAVCKRLAEAQDRARQLALWIGRVTATAAGYLLPARSGRDSQPGSQRNRRQAQGWVPQSRRGSKVPKLESTPSIERITEHIGQGGGSGHALVATGSVVRCRRCGAHSEARCKAVGKACRGKPANAPARARREALRGGRHPVSGAMLCRDDAPSITIPVAEARTDGAIRLEALRTRVRRREAATQELESAAG